MKEFEAYLSPQVEVLEIVVERGYLLSDNGTEDYEIESGTWD